jgi:alpha-N-arabinofuranosidase
MVNTTAKKQAVKINLDGVSKVSPVATLIVVKGNKPDDTNSINYPANITPATSTIKGIAKSFTRNLDPYSVSIFQLQTAK